MDTSTLFTHPIKSTGFTPIPNTLLDDLLPQLRDTELRLLLVVVRQTLGWQGSTPGQRKERDWLSGRQLQRRTGRSNRAVSLALETLVQHGLVEVISDQGILLSTPEQRSQGGSRLWFQVGPVLQPLMETTLPQPTPSQPLEKASPGRDETSWAIAQTSQVNSPSSSGGAESTPGSEVNPRLMIQTAPPPAEKAATGSVNFLHTTKESFHKKLSFAQQPSFAQQAAPPPKGAASPGQRQQNQRQRNDAHLSLRLPDAALVEMRERQERLEQIERESTGKHWHWDKQAERWVKDTDLPPA